MVKKANNVTEVSWSRNILTMGIPGLQSSAIDDKLYIG